MQTEDEVENFEGFCPECLDLVDHDGWYNEQGELRCCGLCFLEKHALNEGWTPHRVVVEATFLYSPETAVEVAERLGFPETVTQEALKDGSV